MLLNKYAHRVLSIVSVSHEIDSTVGLVWWSGMYFTNEPNFVKQMPAILAWMIMSRSDHYAADVTTLNVMKWGLIIHMKIITTNVYWTHLDYEHIDVLCHGPQTYSHYTRLGSLLCYLRCGAQGASQYKNTVFSRCKVSLHYDQQDIINIIKNVEEFRHKRVSTVLPVTRFPSKFWYRWMLQLWSRCYYTL